MKVEQMLVIIMKIQRSQRAELQVVQRQIDEARTRWEQRGRDRAREMTEIIWAVKTQDDTGLIVGDSAHAIRKRAWTADGIQVIRTTLDGIAGAIAATGYPSPADLRVLVALCAEDDSDLGNWAQVASVDSPSGDAQFLRNLKALFQTEETTLKARQTEAAEREHRELEASVAQSGLLVDDRSGLWERREGALHKRLEKYEVSLKPATS